MSKIPVVVGGSTFQAPLHRWQPLLPLSWRASPWPPRRRPPAWPLTLGDGMRSRRRGNRECHLTQSHQHPQTNWQSAEKKLSKESWSRALSQLLKLATKRKTDPKLCPLHLSIRLRNGKLLTRLLRPLLLTLSQKQKQQRSGECLWFRSLSLDIFSSFCQLVFVLVLTVDTHYSLLRRPLPPPLPGRPAIAPNKPSLNGQHWVTRDTCGPEATRECKLSTVIRQLLQHSHHYCEAYLHKYFLLLLVNVSNFLNNCYTIHH